MPIKTAVLLLVLTSFVFSAPRVVLCEEAYSEG